jgi:hypothetical protein
MRPGDALLHFVAGGRGRSKQSRVEIHLKFAATPLKGELFNNRLFNATTYPIRIAETNCTHNYSSRNQTFEGKRSSSIGHPFK